MLPAFALGLLNAPITEEEILESLKLLPSSKSPGPDGLPYEYYKAFLAILASHMARLFNGFMRDEEIPRDMQSQSSSLTLIPKPDKHHTLSGNYRPIALLNSVLKIFMKLLSLRLNEILLSLIHKDQVGLVP